MEKEIINEIRRISELMVLSENAQTELITWLRKFIQNDEQLVRQSLSKTDDDITKAIKKLANNENIDDKLLYKLLRNIQWSKIAKYMIDNGKLGSEFVSDLNKAIKMIHTNPDKETELIMKFNQGVDGLTYLKDSPLELTNSIKSEIKTKIDDGVRLFEQNAIKVYQIIKSEILKSPKFSKIFSKLTDSQKEQFETFVKSNIILGTEKESIKTLATNWVTKHGATQDAMFVLRLLGKPGTWYTAIGVFGVYLLYQGYKKIKETFSGDGELNSSDTGALN